MEKDIKVSVIVPVYNAEKYVKEAIESLIGQTLKEIQIILVDDGSKDNSGKICDEYATKDERISVIHKENGGQADARNAGISIAKGKYIMFLDADDLFEKDSCESMYKTIEKSKTDYVIGNYQMIDEDGKKWQNPAFDTDKYKEFRLDIHDYRKSFFVMNSTVWNKIYNTKFLKEKGVVFKILKPSEDDYFTSLCYIKANDGYYTSKVMYLYRNVPNSTSKKCSLEYFKGINKAYKVIYESFKANNEINYYRYVYAKKNAYVVCQLIDTEELSDSEKIECLKEFEWYFNLSNELKIDIVHNTLKKLMALIKSKDYDNAIIEMNILKEYRKSIPDNIRKRISFPTLENYEQMAKYNDEFKNK